MDIRSVCTASVLLLLSLSRCFLPSAGADLLEYECNNGTSYAANSTYQSNLRSLLASLAANASRSLFPPVGFTTAAVGASPDKVWGLGLCRGDTNGTDCESCLALVPDIAFGQGDYCMGVKEVSVFYDRCLVHYSFRDFLTSPDNRIVELRGAGDDNVTRDAGRFDALVVSLVGALSDWAAFNTTTRYAVGTMVSDDGFATANGAVVHRINGLVQCTPDQAPGKCRDCLQALIDEMPEAFNGSTGGHILRVWCNFRFEVFEFYDGSPMLQLVAPRPAPPPSSTVPTDQTGGNGTRWRQHAATASAIVLGVALILLSIFTILLWRNTRRELPYQEDDDPASLLFNLPTLRRATDNFAEENKLGQLVQSRQTPSCTRKFGMG
uniref:Uncharacterized protein n=1 Tax=Avena sativa TaxID=4498 RepID=A0ACD5WU53_AVESA